MAIQNGVYEMQAAKTQALLTRIEATLARQSPGQHVYVSRKTNQTFTLSALRPGVLRVQVVGGCVC